MLVAISPIFAADTKIIFRYDSVAPLITFLMIFKCLDANFLLLKNVFYSGRCSLESENKILEF